MNIQKQRIAVLGAGQIGVIIAGMLAEQGHEVTLADAAEARLKQVAGGASPPPRSMLPTSGRCAPSWRIATSSSAPAPTSSTRASPRSRPRPRPITST